MAAKGREFTTPIGRLVWGHPLRSQQKRDMDTNQLILNESGQPIDQWAMGVAFTKADFEREIWPHLFAEMATGYPNGAPSNFSYKYIDGDSVDKQGKPYNTREGYAGCYVLTLSTELQAPQVVTMLGSSNGSFRQLTEKEIKTGDYVRVGVNCAVNVPKNRTHTPSLYVNPLGIELIGYGQEIRQGPDVNAMFSQRPTGALPPGASLTPIGGAGPGMAIPGTGGGMAPPANPHQPGAMAPQQPPPGAYHAAPPAQHQQPGMAPPTAPAAYPSNLPPPAHDFVHNATGQQAPQQHAQPGMMPGNLPPPGRLPGQ